MNKKSWPIAKIIVLALGITLLVSTAVLAKGQELPVNLRQMLEKSASLGLKQYPIGFWSYTNLTEHGKYMDEAEVQEWADAGFTVTMTPTFEADKPEQIEQIHKLLDWAHKCGMKLIVCDRRVYGPHHNGQEKIVSVPEDQKEKIAAALKDFDNHPGLFGFYVGDEPEKPNNDAYFQAYRMLKHADPKLHPFMNLQPYNSETLKRVGYPSWAEYLDDAVDKADFDFLCYDCYCQLWAGGNLDGYFENLRVYREAAQRNGVPFWTTILSVGHAHYRCPTNDELRWQFNTAVCSGANGIVWFFYYMREPCENYRLSLVDEHWDRTETYYNIRRFQKSFHRRYGDLFLNLAPVRVTFWPEAFGGGDVFTPNEVVSEVSTDMEKHPLLIGEFVDIQGRRYVMLVNNSLTNNVRASLTFPGKDVKTYSWNWSGQEYQGRAYAASGPNEQTDNGLRIWHWLAPGQEVVYRIDSEPISERKIELEKIPIPKK